MAPLVFIQAKGDGTIGLLIVRLAEGHRGGERVIGRSGVMFKDVGVRLKLKSTNKAWVGRLLREGAQA